MGPYSYLVSVHTEAFVSVLGTSLVRLGARFSTQYLVLGTKYLVLGTWYLVLSTWYLVLVVLGTWYLVLVLGT